MKQLKGNEEFTMTFTSEEWGLLVFGLQSLVQTMSMAAIQSSNLEVLNRAQEVQKKGDSIAEKIATTMGIDLNEDAYTDEVGGHHDSGIGWNPHGVWCGECTKSTCKGCINEHKIEEK